MRDAPSCAWGRVTRAVAAATFAALLAGCTVTYGQAHHYEARYPHATAHPTPQEQATTLAATEGYRRLLLTSAERLSGDLVAIASDAAAGRRTGARRAELDAQAAYDVLRPEIQPDSATANELDGEPGSAASRHPGGLHGIEQALWSREPLRVARRDALSLEPEAVTSAFVFSRAVLTPDVIVAQAQSSLAWAAEVPDAQREEAYSHHDLVDVVATAGAARSAFGYVAPLGRLVAAAATSRAGAALGVLDAELDAIRNPDGRTDATIPPSTWRTLASDLDAADAALGVLGGEVAGFGSGRTYA